MSARQFSAEELADIQCLHREAKDKAKQIEILAQIHCCTKADILRIVKPEAVPLPDRNVPNTRYVSDVRRDAITLYKEGLTRAEIGERLGIPEGTVAHWLTDAANQGLVNKRKKGRRCASTECGSPAKPAREQTKPAATKAVTAAEEDRPAATPATLAPAPAENAAKAPAADTLPPTASTVDSSSAHCCPATAAAVTDDQSTAEAACLAADIAALEEAAKDLRIFIETYSLFGLLPGGRRAQLEEWYVEARAFVRGMKYVHERGNKDD